MLKVGMLCVWFLKIQLSFVIIKKGEIVGKIIFIFLIMIKLNSLNIEFHICICLEATNIIGANQVTSMDIKIAQDSKQLKALQRFKSSRPSLKTQECASLG